MKRLFKRKRLRCYPPHTICESLRSLSVYEQAVPPEINLRGMVGGNCRALSFRSMGSYLGVSSASFTVDAISDDYYDRERNSPYSLAKHVTIDRYLKANEPVDYEESEE